MFLFFLVRVTPRRPVRQLELRAVLQEPITEKVRKSGVYRHRSTHSCRIPVVVLLGKTNSASLHTGV